MHDIVEVDIKVYYGASTDYAELCAGALGPDTPPLRESRSLTYFTDETLQERVERHLHDIVESEVIQRLQVGSLNSLLSPEKPSITMLMT